MSFLPFPASVPWKWIGVTLAALGVVTAVVFGIKAYGSARAEAAQVAERAAWEVLVAEQEAQIAILQRQADANLKDQVEQDDREIASNREEVENAVADLPDARPSPRQLRRACVELRRQGQAPAACLN